MSAGGSAAPRRAVERLGRSESADRYYRAVDALMERRQGSQIPRVFGLLKWAGLPPAHDPADRSLGGAFHPRHTPASTFQRAGPTSRFDVEAADWYFAHRRRSTLPSLAQGQLRNRITRCGLEISTADRTPLDFAGRPLSAYFGITAFTPTEVFAELRHFALSPAWQNRHTLRHCSQGWAAGAETIAQWRAHVVELAERKRALQEAMLARGADPEAPLPSLSEFHGLVDAEVLGSFASSRITASAVVDSIESSVIATSENDCPHGCATAWARLGKTTSVLGRRSFAFSNVTAAGLYPRQEYSGALPPWTRDGTVDALRERNMLPRHMNDTDERFAAFSDSAVSFGGRALRDFVLHQRETSAGRDAGRAPSVREVWDDSGCFLDIASMWIIGSPTNIAQDETIAPFHNAAVDEALHDPAVIRTPQPGVPAGLEGIFRGDTPTGTRGTRDKTSALRQAQSLRSAFSGGLGASGLLGRRLSEACTLADANQRSRELSSVAEQVYAEGGALAGRFFSNGIRFEFETQTSTELNIATAIPQWGLPAVSAIFTSRQHWAVDRLTGDHEVLPLFPEVRFNTFAGTSEQRSMAITVAATELLASFREMRPAVANAVARLSEHRHAVSDSSAQRWQGGKGNAPKWEKGHLLQRHMRGAFDSRTPAPFPCGRDSTYAQPVWLRPRMSLGIASLAPAPMKCVPVATSLRWRPAPAQEQPGYATQLAKLGKSPLPSISRWTGGAFEVGASEERPTKAGGPKLIRRAAVGPHNAFRLDTSDALTDSGALTRTQAFLQTVIQGPQQRAFSDGVVRAGRLVGATGLTAARMRDVRGCTIDVDGDETQTGTADGGPRHVVVKVWPASWSFRVPEMFRSHKVLSRRRPAFLLLMLDTRESRAALWKWLDRVSPTTRHRKLSWPAARGSMIIVGAESGGDATAAFNFPWNAPLAEQGLPCFPLRPEHDRVLTMSSQYTGSGLATASGHRVVVRGGVPFVTGELADMSLPPDDVVGTDVSDDAEDDDGNVSLADSADDESDEKEARDRLALRGPETDDGDGDGDGDGSDEVPEVDVDVDADVDSAAAAIAIPGDGGTQVDGDEGNGAAAVAEAADGMTMLRVGEPVFSCGLLYGFVGPGGKLVTWVESYRLPPRIVPPPRRPKPRPQE